MSTHRGAYRPPRSTVTDWCVQ